MPYAFRFAKLARENLPKVPPEVEAQIKAGFEQLASDPMKYGRRACQPYAPFGYQFDINCRVGNRYAYNCVIFFVYSDCGQFLDVHRMMIQKVGNDPQTPEQAAAGMKIRGPVIDIPQSPPR